MSTTRSDMRRKVVSLPPAIESKPAGADHDLVLARQLGRLLALLLQQRTQAGPGADDVFGHERWIDVERTVGRVEQVVDVVRRDVRIVFRLRIVGVGGAEVGHRAARNGEHAALVARVHHHDARQPDALGADAEVDALGEAQARLVARLAEQAHGVDPRAGGVDDDAAARR